MTDLAQRMVEAGARAMWCRAMGCDLDRWYDAPPHILSDHAREAVRKSARACLTAALALAEGEGVVLVNVPELRTDALGQPVNGTDTTKPWASGHNAAIAATLAGKVTL